MAARVSGLSPFTRDPERLFKDKPMPWTASDMAKKHAKRPAIAAKIANEHLRKTGNEASAIKIGLAVSNHPSRTGQKAQRKE